MRAVTVTGCLAALVVVAAAIPTAVHPRVNLDEQLERDEIIDTVNNAQTTWVAGRNFKSSLTKRYAKNLVGVLMDFDDLELSKPSNFVKPDDDDDIDANDSDNDANDSDFDEIPTEYDARTQYPNCPQLKEIRDQGPCGSCWAVATVSMFTNRLCIATKGKFKKHLSTEDLLSCCCCCNGGSGDGCLGGYPAQAVYYFKRAGVVTGGDYQTKEGCQPYLMPPCEHHIPGQRKNCSTFNVTTPSCSQECYNSQYKDHSYLEDKHTIKWGETLYGPSVKQIQLEMMRHGPVSSQFLVYEDFLAYKSGVYQHITGTAVGGHAVMVIGWGVENGTPYWLMANSWNTDWGDNGYFKIIRGKNECWSESIIQTLYPEVRK